MPEIMTIGQHQISLRRLGEPPGPLSNQEWHASSPKFPITQTIPKHIAAANGEN